MDGKQGPDVALTEGVTVTDLARMLAGIPAPASAATRRRSSAQVMVWPRYLNAVAPGYMDTELTRQYLADHPGRREELVALIPAGRFARIDEVVGPVLFLCSPLANYIHGQVINVTGGQFVGMYS